MRFINKKIIIIPIFLLIIFVLLINFKIKLKIENSKLDEVKLVNDNINNKGFAIMIESDTGEYIESNSNVWPKNKKFNKYLSGCLDGDYNKVEGALIYNEKTNEASVKTVSSLSCYLYFDILGEDKEYTYTGNYEIYEVKHTGYYEIELYGGSGGKSLCNNEYCDITVGKGGYTTGVIKLNEGEKLYIYVGGAGSDGVMGTNSLGGYNGGGLGTWDNSDDETSGGGGGATDIRYFGEYTPTEEELLWNSDLGLNSRIMVAAGGGGSSWIYETSDGGGLYGKTTDYDKDVGTQISGYAFGYGQDAEGVADNDGVGGGGSGYYGGYAYDVIYKSAGTGGSSFISGYAGVNAITSSTDRTHTNNTIHYSNKYFIMGNTISGVNEGNGKAKITFLSSSKPTRINTKLDNVRYIKDCTNQNSVDKYNDWLEIQAIYNGKNVALNKNITFTSTPITNNYNIYAPYSATDGDITRTNYSAFPEGNQCITIDLEKNYSLDEIAIWHYWNLSNQLIYYDNYTYVSNDKYNWVTIMDYETKETSEGKRINAYN